MIQFFQKEQFNQAKKQRNKTLIVYLITLGVYLACVVGIYIWYARLPYRSPQITTVRIVLYALTFCYLVFSFIYLGIAFGRVNKYYKVCYNLIYGRRETYHGEFLRYDPNIEQKDGVDCKVLIFKEWNKYKKNYFERKVLVLNEMEFPEIQPNSNLKYVTQANILISYEYEYNYQEGEQK